MLCSFGCGRPAIRQFKSSGNWCCSKASSSCPSQKTKNEKSKSGLWEHLNWQEIQLKYDAGLSTKKIANEYKISTSVLATAAKHGKFKPRSKAEASALLVGKNSHSPEFIDKLSRLAKDRKIGGYNPNGGRGKKGRYNGIWCDSSWELAFVVYHQAHNTLVVRNTAKFPYEYHGVVKNYIPDFIVNGKYVEIKGFNSSQWEAKKNAFPHELLVLTNIEMQPILDFVIRLHGKDFTNLYE